MSSCKVYKGIGPNEGKIVPTEGAFIYVCNQLGIFAYDSSNPEYEEFKEMLVEWYFSGNWIEVVENG